MKKLMDWYRSQTDVIKGVTIFFTTIILVFIVFLIVTIQMGGKAEELMKPYFVSDNILQKHLAAMKKPQQLSTAYFDIIRMERTIMNTRKQHHYDLAVTFFRNYYGVLVVSMLLSCIGGIILFIMINRGWANAGVTLQSLFLALVISLTFFGFFPLVFQQEKNLNENMTSYMNYAKAEMNVLNQLSVLNNPAFANTLVVDSATKKTAYQYDSLKYNRTADSIVSYNIDRINGLMNYVLNIDSKEIKSIGDVAKMLSTYQSGKDSLSTR